MKFIAATIMFQVRKWITLFPLKTLFRSILILPFVFIGSDLFAQPLMRVIQL